MRRNSILMTGQYPDLGTDASSVWNFYARFSDAIWRGNQCWRREMTAFSQTLDVCTKFCLSSEKSIILSAASVIKARV